MDPILYQPRTFSLERIVFHDSVVRISYHFSLDGQDRVVVYDLVDRDHITAEVRPAPGQPPLLWMNARPSAVRIRTAEGEFPVGKGARIPSSTDARALWVLAQNFLNNSTTIPQLHLDQVAELLSSPSART